MRRLAVCWTAAMLAAVLAVSGCKPREKVRLEPTEEQQNLLSTVHMADPAAARQIVSGFHNIEQNSWRWTSGRFAVTLKPPPSTVGQGARLVAHLSVPDPVIQRLGTIKLTASAQGADLGSASYSAPGEQLFQVDVPPAVTGDQAVMFQFTLDRFLAAGTVDARELGVIVSSIGLEPK